MFDFKSIYIWAGVGVAALLIVPYILGPLMLRLTMTQQANPEVVPFPADHPSLPALVREHFRKVTDQLAGVGFEAVAGLALPRQMQNVKAIVLMFANRETKDAAVASVICADLVDPPIQTAYVEIVSRFRDDTTVSTINAAEIGSFPPRPGHYTGRFPSVQDAAELYRIHQAMSEQHGGTDKVLRLDENFQGDGAAYLAFAMREELDAQIASGYLYLAPEGDVFRPTWKGAFLICWKLLFPWKQIQHARRDRDERRILAELRASGVLER